MAKKKGRGKRAKQGNAECFQVHLIAAATGDLLYRLASVAITQFSGVEFELIAHTLTDDLDKLGEVLEKVQPERSFVVHALADPKAKALVRTYCVPHRIPEFDATGPLLNFFADCVGRLPDNDITRLHRVDSSYLKRIEAMEFAMEHDDGLGLATLREAEIVIVGVSRVSKSPTTLYLGARGYKVANVSISPLTGFPKELSRVPKGRVIALTSQPKRLQEIRRDRMRRTGVEGVEYDELKSVIREVLDAESEYRGRGWPIVDVTTLTIEQTAAHILEALGLPPH